MKIRLRLASALLFFILIPAGGPGDSASRLSAQPGNDQAAWRFRPETLSLDSGPDCFFLRDTRSEVTVVDVFIPGGRSAVAQGQDGLAYLAARLAVDIQDSDQARFFISTGAEMRVSVNEKFTVIEISCLSGFVSEALRIIGRMIGQPLFTSVRIKRIKDMMPILRNSEEEDASSLARKSALGQFFAGCGPGSETYGTNNSLGLLSRKKISAFYEEYFSRDNVFCTVVSDLDGQSLKPGLETLFEKFPPSHGKWSAPMEPSGADKSSLSLARQTNQTFVGRYFILPTNGPAEYAMAGLVETVLGKSPGSLLWKLRQEQQLAYSSEAGLVQMGEFSLLEAHLKTSPENLESARNGLDLVITSLREKGITAGQLRIAANKLKTEFLRQTEGKQSRARAMGTWHIAGLGYDFINRFFQVIDSVDIESLNLFIKNNLDLDRSVLIIVGPNEKSSAGGLK